jgi:hypothetical protein
MVPLQFYTGIQLRTQVFVLLVGLAMLLFVLNMVRRKRLREQYALLWILSAMLLALAAVFIQSVERLSHLVGIYYPPAFLFLLAILVLFVLAFHFSTVISNLREQNKALTQELGLLASEVRELRRGPGSGADALPATPERRGGGG